jgi:hypothetical protein
LTIASKRAGFALACAFAVLSSAAAGQTSGVATPDPAAPPVDRWAVPGAYPDAPVTVFNRTIVVFKGPVFGNSPAERATHARKRIVTLLERPGPGVVSIETIPQGKLVKIDGVFALGITPADLDAMAGETLDGVTADAVQALESSGRAGSRRPPRPSTSLCSGWLRGCDDGWVAA